MKLLTLGTFDLFHRGHVNFLRQCRGLVGDEGVVVVGLNTDRFAASYKRPPAIDYAGREAVLLACRYVDTVTPNDQADGSALDVLELIEPDIVAATMDYHPSNGKNWFVQVGVSEAWFASRGIELAWIPYTAGVSSTSIARRL